MTSQRPSAGGDLQVGERGSSKEQTSLFALQQCTTLDANVHYTMRVISPIVSPHGADVGRVANMVIRPGATLFFGSTA